ncbi:hypothetical protein DFP72DRAFT_1170624 [Ephemerocybe angulata]|uniref:Uncharacterized protein n=1 Tax=Ephemerocybe angulata TaxID=980116 RepID=A0A8H6HVV2_9AGAR|nr:hypothetical protein DFP72DRAFT_1170624 [Tulosesus angulatus]
MSTKLKLSPELGFVHQPAQASLLNIAAFWYRQAKEKGEGEIFMCYLLGKFFTSFPDEHLPGIKGRIAHVEASVRAHMEWAYPGTSRVRPKLPWEVLFALPRWQFEVMGRKLRRLLKEVRRDDNRRYPGKSVLLVDLILVEDEVSVEVVCQDPEDVGGEWVVDNGSDLEPGEGEASDSVPDGEGCDDRGDDGDSDCDCSHSVMEDSEQDEGTVSSSEGEANGGDDSNNDSNNDSDDDSNNDSDVNANDGDTTYVEYYDYYRNAAVIDGNFQLRPRVREPVETDDSVLDSDMPFEDL